MSLPLRRDFTAHASPQARSVLYGKVRIAFYGLNHIGMMRQLNMSFGNEGKDIICASLFDKDDLAPFQGKYITHVSALVNYMYGYEDKSGIPRQSGLYSREMK